MSQSTPTLYGNDASFIAASMQNSDALDSLWLPRNQKAAKFFGVAAASVLALIAVLHWSAFFLSKSLAGRRLLKPFLHIARKLNSIETGQHGPPLGYVAIMAMYLGINLTMALYDRPYDSGILTTFAQRMGWLSLCNLCTTVFLSLKNTPLFLLAGRSFDEINVLHRCAGYSTIGCMIIHSISYLNGLTQINLFAYTMQFPRNHWSGVAGVSMLIILCTATGMIRRRHYEIFYLLHVVFGAVILIAVGFHRDEVAQGELVITILAATMWFVDKMSRWIRWAMYSYGNYCTIEALPHEATKITMNRSIRALPGSMCRIYIPSVCGTQRHPFSVAANDPATFIVKARNGFTKALYEKALSQSSSKIRTRASFEGPYGGFADLEYSNVVLFAGGSGITFSVSVAMAWVKAAQAGATARQSRSRLELHWSVRDEACISWLDDWLPTLETDPRVQVNVYVSQSKSRNNELPALSKFNNVDVSRDVEKSDAQDVRTNQQSTSSVLIHSGRSDVDKILGQSLDGLTKKNKFLVTACGPKPLAMSVRKAVAACDASAVPSIKMHIEEFSF